MPGLVGKISGKDAISIPAGTILMREGETGRCAYMLLEGRLQVERSGKDGPIDLGEIIPVNLVGELAILGEVPRTATVIVLEDSKLIELNKHRLRTIIRRYPDIAEIIIKILCQRISNTTNKLAEITTPESQQKIETPKVPLPQAHDEPVQPSRRMATAERRQR